MRCRQLLQPQPPEQFREHGQEEVRLRADQLRAINREPAARHDHVHVRVMRHRRAPRVQHRRNADRGTQMLLVGGDSQHRLVAGLEQGVVDDRLATSMYEKDKFL